MNAPQKPRKESQLDVFLRTAVFEAFERERAFRDSHINGMCPDRRLEKQRELADKLGIFIADFLGELDADLRDESEVIRGRRG